MKLEKSKVNEDIESVKERYNIRFKKSFEDIFECYTLGNEKEQKVSKEELYLFVNKNFDEINAEFTLRVNDFGNEIPLEADGDFNNWNSTMITLDKELNDIQSSDGIGFIVNLPSQESIVTILFHSIAKIWNNYNQNKLTKLYSRVNEYCFREIPLDDEIWYD